jgi:hypothetical protein
MLVWCFYAGRMMASSGSGRDLQFILQGTGLAGKQAAGMVGRWVMRGSKSQATKLNALYSLSY